MRNLEKAANEFSKIEEPDFQKKLWTLALNIHWILAGLYMKQYRLYEAQEILRVLKDFAPYDHDKGFEFNKASVESLINTCKNRVSCWETQEKKMKQLFEKASKEYGSYLETGNFYFRIGDYDRAKSAYSKEIEEDKSLLDRDICNSVGVSIRKARIVAAFFGLAQTHLVMMDVDKAVQALDMGSSYISDMDTSTGDHGSEFRILLTDLYEKCAIINKSRSLHEKVDAV